MLSSGIRHNVLRSLGIKSTFRLQAIVVCYLETHLMLVRRLLIVLCIDQLGNDLSRMTGRIEMVGVFVHFLFSTLFAAVSGENVLVVVEIVVIVLIKESFRHIYD